MDLRDALAQVIGESIRGSRNGIAACGVNNLRTVVAFYEEGDLYFCFQGQTNEFRYCHDWLIEGLGTSFGLWRPDQPKSPLDYLAECAE